MPLESRRNQTYNDDRHSQDGDDALYNAIKVGLAGLGLYKLMQTGALKEVIGPMMEVADKIAAEGTNKGAATMSSIKQWSKLSHLTPAQAAAMSKTPWSAPEYSFFRLGAQADGTDSFAYSLITGLRGLIYSDSQDFWAINRYIEGTKQDMNVLKGMINENIDNLKRKRSQFVDTDLYDMIKGFDRFSTTLEHEAPAEQMFLKQKYLEEMLDYLTQDADKNKDALKMSGYRKATLKDIAVLKGRQLVLKDDAQFKAQDLLDAFNDMAADPHARTNNVHIFKSGAWKDIALDSRLRISEDASKTVDYRMVYNDWIGFVQSLATDFGLPAVKFNPFKTIFGMDKYGRKKPFGGWLSANQIDPSITGHAGRYTIGQWLSDTFGDDMFRLPGQTEGGARGIAVINGKAFVATKNAETGQLSSIAQVGEHLKLYDITHANKSMNLTPSVNAERQMAGLDLGHAADRFLDWDTYAKELEEKGIHLGRFQKIKHGIGHVLNMGHQEIRYLRDEDTNFFESVGNIDELFNNGINKISRKDVFRMSGFEYNSVAEMFDEVGQGKGGVRIFDYKSVFGNGPAAFTTGQGRDFEPRMYFAQKAGVRPNDMISSLLHGKFKEAGEQAKPFFAQFVAGRSYTDDNLMSKYFTEYSGGPWSPWTFMNALSEGIGSSAHQLGLSTESKKNAGVMLKNLLIKRALPVYMLTQIPGYINYLSEPFMKRDEKTGQPDNIGRWMMRGPVRSLDVTAHKVLNFTGVTNIFKKGKELVPGYDQLNETIPFVRSFGLDQTEEEREEWIENGYEPVRKGRYWSLGNTPWTGTKIMYWRPNIYRRVQADVKFSDSKWGSRQEYYRNAWFPSPFNLTAPLNHFVLDRNHYDKKHYFDRPYLQTAPAGANIPIVGPIFSQTIGRVIAPPVKMHREYLRNGLRPLPEDEVAPPIITTGQLYRPADMSIAMFYTNEQIKRLNQQIAYSQQRDAEGRYASEFAVRQSMKRSFSDATGFPALGFLPGNRFSTAMSTGGLVPTSVPEKPSLPTRNYDRYNGNPLEIYRTPSGGMSIVDVPDELNLYNVNRDLQAWSINKVIGTNRRVDLVTGFQGGGLPVGNDFVTVDNSFITRGFAQQYNTLTDVAGLKGFAIRQFGTGEMGVRSRVAEDSSYAYGMNKSLWDQNLGGLGANLSEITRRFVPDRNNNIDYINPIRNTMPNWMPGSNYFTDFKHGDPYSKIMNGEERLPGEGYERLYGIDNLLDMHIGVSSIGYSRADIVKKFIGQGGYTSAVLSDTAERGTKLHEMVEKSWLDTGFAISVEQKVVDKRNGITGVYDALVHDPTSATGVALIDIKSVSKKKLDEARSTGMAQDKHMKQLNYYMWATNNTASNGYIYYIDRDNPYDGYMAPVTYSHEVLKETLENVYGARGDVREALKKGIINRGDLYSPMDKFRILADVAPYSQEYEDAAAQISNMKLTEEQKKETAAIRDRVKEQKEPLRVYPYKFKTSNLKTEFVTVKEIIDNNTLLTYEYGTQHAVKFAGIHVSESNTEKIDKKKIKYTDENGRTRYKTVGIPLNTAARREIEKHVRPGMRIAIQYDADEKNKFSKDSTRSIRAVIRGPRGENVNQILLNRNLATEKESDNSPAGIHARYTKGEIAFGNAMEKITHGIISNIPFVGSKVLQVQSPYEAYKRREVYGKDFQSWNHPISGILVPNVQRHIGEYGTVAGIGLGAFMGSLFGKNRFGKMVGATVGAGIVAGGKIITSFMGKNGRPWRPQRRVEQENINEYVDMLKYVKNMRLYEQYKAKAKEENHFDVDAFMESGKARGVANQIRRRELEKYKKTLKLDFNHRRFFKFKTGVPKYADTDMSYKEAIHAINQEIMELQSDRKVIKAPANAMKAIGYKQAADATMYGFEPGDSLVNIMSALPKKERQYFKHFMNAPEEEKQKTLNIAPSYLRRALQSSWGMKVDPKPTIDEYFSKHGLPDANWIGWREESDIEDVKVKIVHKEKADPGEFDIWADTKRKADQSEIPVPNIHATNTRAQAQQRLMALLGSQGYTDIRMRHGSTIRKGSEAFVDLDVSYDAREDCESVFATSGW